MLKKVRDIVNALAPQVDLREKRKKLVIYTQSIGQYPGAQFYSDRAQHLLKMTMDLKESPQEMWDKPQITIDMVRPHIQAFSEGLTGVQWELLESGKPDEATKFALAELLLNLITTLSGVLVKQLKNNVCISEELVLDSISEPVSQGFAEVLNTSLCSSFRSSSLEKLTSSLGEEVTVSVNTTQLLSSSSPPRSKRVTPTNRAEQNGFLCMQVIEEICGQNENTMLRTKSQSVHY